MAGTGVVVAERSFDLSRNPAERWDAAMLDVVTRNVFRGMQVTERQLYFCLSVAEALNLNPMIGEIYFIPGKSSDGKGPAFQPYIGRSGLVKKARERGYYYEAETVHENDKFTVRRKSTHEVLVTHSYGLNRGGIVAAYAFLHRRNGSERPAFFLAPIEEYKPTFDAEWKLAKSSWGNQTSAMIEKCAMIGAGRKRLDLGNVLADGEIERVAQMAQAGPGMGLVEAAAGFDWSPIVAAGGREVADAIRDAVDRVREYDPHAWPAAKLEMVTAGMTAEELARLAEAIEGDAAAHESPAAPAPAQRDESPAEGAGEPGGAGSGGEAIPDAVVVADEEHVRALEIRLERLGEDLNDPGLDHRQMDDLQAEFDLVERELAAARNPGQGRLV